MLVLIRVEHEYTPLDDIYEGKTSQYTASPIIETTRENAVEEIDFKPNQKHDMKKESD